jgi:FemAB-related protein (PEP-CTERM system-associated)
MMLHPQNANGAEEVRVTVETAPPAWGDYLAKNPAATLFHDPRWGALMREVYGNRPHYLSARRAGALVGILQLVEKRSLLFGSHLCSVPYFDASGILADDDAAREALLAEAVALRERLGVAWVELRQREALSEEIPARTDKVTVRLELPREAETLWNALKPKVRNQVRKAEKENQAAEEGGAELLDDFYAIYLRNMRDLGSPPHAKRFFEAIVSRFPDAFRIHVVRLEGGRPTAASLTLRDRHGVCVPWAGSDWRFRDACGNMLLYWSMLSAACASLAGVFDFGRGTVGGGTHRFKLQWGGLEHPLHWHYLLRKGEELPGLRHDNPKFKLAEACWKKLPLCMARIAGPHIIGRLS